MFPTFTKKFLKKKEAVSIQSGSLGGPAPAPPKKKDARFLISLMIFILSVAGTAGMYGMNRYTDSRIARIERDIIRQEETLQPEVIRNLDSFNKQVRILSGLSEVRGGYVPILYEMGRIVVPGVRYTSATVSVTPERLYRIAVRGTADSLLTYLQQAAVISALEGPLEGISFGGYTIQRSEGGGNTVEFSLEAEIEPSVLLSGTAQTP